MEEELKTIETVDTSPFKHLVMTLGELPTSFVDSMTYYECLAWLVNYIQNTVIPAVNNNAEAVEELQTAFITLKNFVDNYFDNLDVQEEINNKLDEMASDGTLGSIIEGYIQPYLSQTNIRIDNVENDINSLKNSYGSPLKASTVAEMTDTNKIYVYTGSESDYTAGHWYYYDGTEWVDGGVYQSAAVETDKTLSLEGEPADSAFTGLLKNGVNTPFITISSILANKIRNNTTGVYTNDSTRLTTTDFVRFNDYVKITVPTGYRVGTWCKTDPNDSESPSITAVQWSTTGATLLPNVDYIVCFTHAQSQENINLYEISNMVIEYGCIIMSNGWLPKFITSENPININTNSFLKEGSYLLSNWYLPSRDKFTVSNLPLNVESGCVIYVDRKYTSDSGSSFIYQTLVYYNLNIKYERLMNTDGTPRIDWTRILPVQSTKEGKKLSIYGDSISTYDGWIPEGNASWYHGNNGGVTNVNQTWWKEVIDTLQYDLVVNNSWSGRCVSSIRDNTSGHTTDAGYKQTNIDALSTNGQSPDEIIIKLGINDFISNCELGDYDGSTQLPESPAKFTDAYAIMLDRISTTYPLAKVYCCTLSPCERLGETGFPEINGRGDTLLQWNIAIKKLALAFGCEILDHANCGLTYYNLSTYMGDYSSSTGQGLHPNKDGMALIANQTIQQLDNAIRTRF